MKTITLAEICKTKKVAPKIARARLRRAISSDQRVQPIKDERWVWPISKTKLIAEYISD
jgi:hypothetical protein